MRFVVQTFLKLQRLEVLLAVMLPFFLILESALANGTVYNGGPLDIHDPRSWIAFGRGLFFEVLTYASAKLTKLLLEKKQKKAMVIPAFVALWCIIVSAGNNLGWVLSGGEFMGMLASMGRFFAPWFMSIYQAGLGLLLPISVGALALVDVSHMVHEALENVHLDNRALQVAEQEMHRSIYLKGQKKQRKKIQERYDAVAEGRAEAFIKRVEAGDVSFGANQKALGGAPGVRRLPSGSAFQVNTQLGPGGLPEQMGIPGPGLPTQQATVLPNSSQGGLLGGLRRVLGS